MKGGSSRRSWGAPQFLLASEIRVYILHQVGLAPGTSTAGIHSLPIPSGPVGLPAGLTTQALAFRAAEPSQSFDCCPNGPPGAFSFRATFPSLQAPAAFLTLWKSGGQDPHGAFYRILEIEESPGTETQVFFCPTKSHPKFDQHGLQLCLEGQIGRRQELLYTRL